MKGLEKSYHSRDLPGLFLALNSLRQNDNTILFRKHQHFYGETGHYYYTSFIFRTNKNFNDFQAQNVY